MKKVYCKNCKYFGVIACYDEEVCKVATKNGSPYFNEKYIDHKGFKSCRWKNREEFDKLCEETETKPYKDGSVFCCNFNLENDCRFYKRKWYKVWIKK